MDAQPLSQDEADLTRLALHQLSQRPHIAHDARVCALIESATAKLIEHARAAATVITLPRAA